MGSRDPLYRVRVSSSGLIYAVIVGAWAAYLVPMWLRRQDELNEARPTERFSTAIRLLSGKAGMERRYARDAERRRVRERWEADDPYAPQAGAGSAGAYDGYDGDAYRNDPDAADESVDVRAFADPKTMVGAPGSEAPTEVHAYAQRGNAHDASARAQRVGQAHAGPRGAARPEGRVAQEGHDHPGPSAPPSPSGHDSGDPAHGGPEHSGAGDAPESDDSVRGGEQQGVGNGAGQLSREQSAQARAAALAGRRARQAKRAKLLARRRRTTMLLFLAFTVGSVFAAVRGLALLWVPAVPALLLSIYIAYLRIQERRRFAVAMDRRQAEEAARTLHARRRRDGDVAPDGHRRAEAWEADTEPGLPARAAHSAGRDSRHPAAAHPRTGPGPEGARARHDGQGPEGRRPGDGSPDQAADASGHARRQGGATASGGRDARQEAARARDEGARVREEAARVREEQGAAERRALVEQTDHAEWVDQQRARERDSSDGEGWEPVPVPLPTYVSAPVAPRATRGVDLEAPDAWSSARSSTASAADPQAVDGDPHDADSARPRHHHDRDRTPLFDQYEDEDRPRAANE
ncbi:hypothetical protein MMF93_14060 [Streptomyces tubbatahanensis]|uniref:Integral membrane protein n=1 Tax=Streptomyces tubbatahanensis TaxID=2923272 RepID=A0ABY3XSQ7_9ACTN|nr:gephyrin-like molybdotransferase receptor GlpR [Streptomyces tubbatahanensis]UNS97492.1 hypothetical protein MMF93_14060 [Streptomyces tubbatahanensis]